MVEVTYRCRRCYSTLIVISKNPDRIKKRRSCPYCASGKMKIQPKANR